MRVGVFRAFLRCAVLFAAALFLCTCARAASVERVSVSSTGEQGDDWCGNPSISADGRFVAFSSDASDLLWPSSDANKQMDVFLHTHPTNWNNG